MAATFTLSGNIANAPGVLFASRQVSLYVLPSQNVTDASTGISYFGPIKVPVDNTGLWSVDLLATNASDIIPPPFDGETFKYRILIRYVDVQTTTVRDALTGWFDLTADLNFEDIDVRVLEQVTAEYAVNLLASAGEARDQAISAKTVALQAAADAVDISNIAVPDGVVEALVKGTAGAGPLTRAALSASIGAAISPLVTAPDNTMIVFGTSLDAQNGAGPDVLDPNGTDANQVRGWWTWMNYFLANQMVMVRNAGVGGNTYAQMRARIQADVLAYVSSWVSIGGPINDIIQGRTSAAVIADLDAMLALLSGRRILIQTSTATAQVTGSMIAVQAAADAYIRSLPATHPNVVVVDAFKIIAAPGTTTAATGMTILGANGGSGTDNLHWSAAAALRVGQAAAEAIRPWVVARLKRPSFPGDPASVVADPSFATGWGKQGGSETAIDTSTPGKLVLTITGNTDALAERGAVHAEDIDAGAKFAPGDIVQATVRVRWRALVPSSAQVQCTPRIIVRQRIDGGGFANEFEAPTASSNQQVNPVQIPTGGEVVLSTARMTILTRTPRINLLYIYLEWVGAASVTAEFSDLAFVKVG